MGSLSHWVTKLIKYLLKPCFSLFCIFLLIWDICVYVKQLDLFINIIDSLLEIAFLTISREVQRLEWWEGSHDLFIAHVLRIFSSNFSTNSLKFFSRKLNIMALNKSYQHFNIDTFSIILIYIGNYFIELKSIFLDKLFS